MGFNHDDEGIRFSRILIAIGVVAGVVTALWSLFG